MAQREEPGSQQDDSDFKVNGVMAEEETEKEPAENNVNSEADSTTTTCIKPAITPEDEICFCQNVLERLKESKDPIVKMSGFAILNSLSWSYLNNIASDTKFYNQVLELLSKSPAESAPQDAMDILRQMEDQAFVQGVGNVAPTLDTYIHVMKTWINAEKNGVVRNGHLVAEMLLIELWEKYNSGQHNDLKPDSSIYKRVLNAWARRSMFDPKAGQQAEYWLRDMIRRYLDGADADVQPAPVHFNAVLQSWANSMIAEDPDQLERHMEQLVALEKPFESTSSWSTLYLHLFREFTLREDPAGTGEAAEAALRLLKYVTGSDRPDKRNVLLPHHEREATELVVRELCFSNRLYEADALLKTLQARFEAGERAMKPSPASLDLVFEKFCKMRHKQAPEEAEKILRKELVPSLKQKDRKMQLRYFENAIAAWTFTTDSPKSAREVSRAEDLFNEMQEDFSLDPNPYIYRCLTRAWASVETDDAPAKAQFHLSEMVLRLKKGDVSFKPDHRLFEFVLLAWLRIDRPEKAEAVIRGMNFLADHDVLDSGARRRSYNAVLISWATGPQRRENGDRAMALYEIMKKRGIRVSNSAYTYLLDLWTRRPSAYAMNMVNKLIDDYKQDPYAEPQVVVYNLALKMWSNDRIPGFDDNYAIVRAERLMDEMRAAADAGNENMRPDLFTYTTMIQLLSKCRDLAAPEKAQELLEELKRQPGIRPDLQIYNAVIAVWSRSKRKEATQRVLQLLNEMSTSDNKSIRPDIYTMNSVISTMARGRGGGTSSPHRAKSMIDSMWEKYETGESNFPPDLITYNTLAGAWSRYGTEEAPIEATKLLREMWQLYNQGKMKQSPDNRTYSSVIAAWARSDHPAAADRAEKLLNDLRGRYHASGNDPRFRPDRIIMRHVEDARDGQRRDQPRRRYTSD